MRMRVCYTDNGGLGTPLRGIFFFYLCPAPVFAGVVPVFRSASGRGAEAASRYPVAMLKCAISVFFF